MNVIHHLAPSTDRDQIITKHSALLEVEQEEQIPVDADHSIMCKFEAGSDDIFEAGSRATD